MRWLLYAGMMLVGALLFSQAIAMMGLDPMPGDIAYDRENWHIHIPVIYSLVATVSLIAVIWFLKK